ncbi:MAG: ABC transporter ATP-binding protein [Geminicoccaceae bacterium]|nr:ABC transporter ATP-binding protein [Geminicoccaceae bacterium]
MTGPLLRIEGLTKRYRPPSPLPFLNGPPRTVLDAASFTLAPGEALGIVGGSGSGKSTLALCGVGLLRPDAGRVVFAGRDVTGERAPPGMQMVFQDPKASLDPRRRIAAIVGEPLRPAKGEREGLVAEALGEVGLDPAVGGRLPHELSGGQRQRVAIARALVARPRLVWLDEPVSALDVSVQAQVLALLWSLRERHGLAYILISHDLAVVARTTERLVVMEGGRIVEAGTTAEVLARPCHPYTQTLLDAVLPFDPKAAKARLERFRRDRPRGA